MERAAKPGEIAQIQALLREAVVAGAFGWTTTTILQHVGYKGRPLACRQAIRRTARRDSRFQCRRRNGIA
jgi:N-acyl-D-aspartate/D-glutamate deacylase